VGDLFFWCSEFCANLAGRLTDGVLFLTTFPENGIGQQVCVEFFHTLMEYCHLTSLEISLEGLLVGLFPMRGSFFC
jgi:hypothetical protein